MNEWAPGTRRVDVVILTAIRLEFDAVLQVDAGAVPGSVWEEASGPSGLPVAFRSFVVKRGRPLRIAVAVAPDMGATAAANTLLPLVEQLQPRCIAMCGVCAGRRGKVRLGDVVAADRLYYHDAGKQLPGRVQQDLTTYKLRDDWKSALEGMDAVAQFRDEAWFQARPITAEWRERRALLALRDRRPEPWQEVETTLGVGEWQRLVTALRDQELLATTGRELTPKGHRFIGDVLFEHMNALPDLSPTGTLHPFCLHVAPIGSGARVVEDETIWSFVSQAMRKTLGLEMEAAALGELVHRQRQYTLDAIVMKGVMDFADHGRDDHFKEFAARASAECLLWFLRERLPTEVATGFDDLLTPGTLPVPQRELAPSMLLDARYAVIPWYKAGRAEILADLDAWADDPSRGVAVRLLHAEGGVGKTRLAIEWTRRRRERHDVAGFLIPDPDHQWLERLCGFGPLVLVVIDRAETRADLAAVLQRVAVFAASSGPLRRIRVLLLARSDGDWWTALRQQNPDFQGLLDGRAPVRLPPLAASSAEREAVFAEASRVFAAMRHRAPVLRPPFALHDVRFERVLYLHMAALAATEGTAPESARAIGSAAAQHVMRDANSLMGEILAHEERSWVREAHDRSTAVDVSLARQLIAAAFLRGGCAVSELGELCARLAGRPCGREENALIALLHDIYGSADKTKHLPALEPGLLGEGMILRVAAPRSKHGAPAGEAWIERVLVPGDDVQTLATAFTVLGHAAETDPATVRPWIASLLRTELSVRAVPALRAGRAVGRRTSSSVLGELLADALEREGSVSIALDLAEQVIPNITVALGRVAEWRSQMLLGYVPDKPDAPETATGAPQWNPLAWLRKGLRNATPARAAAMDQLSIKLFKSGQRERALAVTREAVEIRRTIAAHDADSWRDLANSLGNLGGMLSELGQHKLALGAARESVYLYRTLAARNPDVFQGSLARSLLNLGGVLGRLGQSDAALAVTREAADIHRALAARDPDRFVPSFAMNLNNLGALLGVLGQREPALGATHEAVGLFRALAKRDPAAFQPDLAMGLGNLGSRLNELGQRSPALAATREAAKLYRTLAADNPGAFQSDLAMSLGHLGARLSELGQHEPALAATREAVDMARTLVKRNSDAFQLVLAMSLDRLSSRLAELGQREPALDAIREAVDLLRQLAVRLPDGFRPHLADSLNNLGNRLAEFGQHGPALVAAREAVDLFRSVALLLPGGFRPYLAASLNNLGSRFAEVGQREPALAVTREAVEIYRPFAVQYPDAFQPDLASSLNNLGSRLAELGLREPALAAASEAAALYRTFAARYPDAFRPELAASLRNLGRRLGELGQRESALAPTCEAVELYRTLAIHRADAFLTHLAASLHDLGRRLGDLGQYEPALAATREAVDRYRALVIVHPGAFQPALAASLHDLAITWGELGEHEPACSALREAVDLYRTLAEHHPESFLPALAACLNNLAARFRALGQRAQALVTTREAVDLYRALNKRTPHAFLPDLATSLENLGCRLRDLGQRAPALVITREAVDLYRALARRNPSAFLRDLATSLDNLSVRLRDLDEHEPALAATREAEDIRRSLALGDGQDGHLSGQHRLIWNHDHRITPL